MKLICNIFLLCYNEEILVPHTINHYSHNLPSCNITVLDNHSTDNSTKILNNLGIRVIQFDSMSHQDEIIQRNLKNSCWNEVRSGWIIVADMDEWLTISENELLEEQNNGTTILSVQGLSMIGNSSSLTLSDIDLQSIQLAEFSHVESKNLCFLRDSIQSMNYRIGGHSCKPVGTIKYSDKIYLNKHMNYLGVQFMEERNKIRFQRSQQMRKYGWNLHYTTDSSIISKHYVEARGNSFWLPLNLTHLARNSSIEFQCGHPPDEPFRM